MRPLLCWLGAHEDVRVHAPHRVYLRCTVCGRETPGWRDDDPDVARPTVRYATADARYSPATPKRRRLTVVAGKARRTA